MSAEFVLTPFRKLREQPPQPGEVLLKLECCQDVYVCELHDQAPNGIDCQWYLNGELLQRVRFKDRALAVSWASQKSRNIFASEFDCP